MTRHGKISEDKQRVSLLIEKELIEKVDKLAAKRRISRNQLLRNMIYLGCDEAGIIDKFGVFGVIGFIRELKDRLKEEEIEDIEPEDEE